MKSNVSKFLIKSILSTISVATLAPGFVSGMEKTYETGQTCTICLSKILKDDVPKLKENQVRMGDTYKLNGCVHRFCKGCIKKWMEKYPENHENQQDGEPTCPICRKEIHADEVERIKNLEVKRIRHNLKIAPGQLKAINLWNEKVFSNRASGYDNYSTCYRKEVPNYLELIKLESTSDLMKIMGEKYNKYKYFKNNPVFDSEEDFVDTNLGMCFACDYIMERPKPCNMPDVKKTKNTEVLYKFDKCIKKCPGCGQQCINPVGTSGVREYEEETRLQPYGLLLHCSI